MLAALFLVWGCGNNNNPDVGGGTEDTGSGSDGETIKYDTGEDEDTAGADTDEMGGGDTAGPMDGGQDGDGGANDCPNQECEPPATVCTKDGLFQQCIRDRNGCGTLQLPEECPGEQTCVNGGCQETNPCIEGTDNCGDNATCKPAGNQQGYRCECQGFYKDYHGDGTLCYDESKVLAEAGTFQMGSPSGEKGADTDETRHTVELTRPFLVEPYEIAISQWSRYLPSADDPTMGSNCTANSCPIRNITWWAALKFLNEMSKSKGLEACYTLNGCSGTPGSGYTCSSVDFKGLDCKGWRLPTEAEWEYATRAGTQTATYQGDLTNTGKSNEDPKLGPIAWYAANSDGRAHSGGVKTQNPWGLFDTSGNVSEWTWDRYTKDMGGGTATDPTGPSSGSQRVVRGGAYDSPAKACRSAARHKAKPDSRSATIGLRPVRTMPSKKN